MGKFGLDWPAGFERTEPDDRERSNKFSAGVRQSKSEIKGEMERLEAENWRLDDVSGSGGEPGIVLRWQKDGQDYAVACDAYETKSSNIRSVFLWVKETRKRADRPVQTGSDEFAAAALPPGDEENVKTITAKPAHEVLGVAPDAPENIVQAAAKARMKEVNPDKPDGDEDEYKRVLEARDVMLDDE